MDLKKLRQDIDSILSDSVLMKQIYVPLDITREEMSYCGRNFAKEFLKNNFNLSQNPDQAVLQSIYDLWYSHYKMTDTLYRENSYIGADIVNWLISDYHLEELPSREWLLMIFRQRAPFLLKNMFHLCFYVDPEGFEYHLWANHREEIEEILRRQGENK